MQLTFSDGNCSSSIYLLAFHPCFVSKTLSFVNKFHANMFVDHNVIFYWISYRPQTAHFCFTAPGGGGTAHFWNHWSRNIPNCRKSRQLVAQARALDSRTRSCASSILVPIQHRSKFQSETARFCVCACRYRGSLPRVKSNCCPLYWILRLRPLDI